jgi:hypothetical protein
LPDPLVLAVGRARTRLNAVVALHRALVWAAPSAVVSGLAAAIAHALGLGLAGFPLMAALSLAGAAAGALSSRSSFLSEEGAARWLDSRLGDDELFASALACLHRGGEGRFDRELIERATNILPRAASIKAPRAPTAKRGGVALAAVAIGAYAILISGTIAPSQEAAARDRSSQAAAGPAAKAPTAASALEEGGRAAAEFAASLFPDDRRRATLAERALREGRIDDMRDLLKAAGLELDSKLANSISESERRKFATERDRLGKAASSLAAASKAASMRGPGSRGGTGNGEANDRGVDSRGSPGAHERSPNASPDFANAKSGNNGGSSKDGVASGGEKGRSGDTASGGGADGVGSGAGSGSGSDGDWGPIKSSVGSGTISIAADKTPSYFELVLPGSDTTSPTSSFASTSRKSAEAAMSREALPLEYENFIRSYFMTLSQGESR